MSLSSLDLLSEGLFAAPDDEVLTAFIGMVRASAREATPAERMLVADRLHDLAIQRGLDALVGEDAIQNEIAQAFDESGLNDKVQDDWGEPKSNGHDTQLRLIQSSAEFIKDFQPPDYLIDGILQRRFLYAFTGKTGSGKTAIVLHWAAMVALGRKIGEIETQQGRVVYFAGENPDDIRMRWIAMSQQFSFDANAIPVYFIPGRFKISEMRLRIIEETLKIGAVALVIIDTSAAYYEGVEVNSNTEQAAHGQRFRSLIELPGRPCVIANCHPVKNASADNMLPLGAGAFLNEIDGNLICIADFPAIEVHWQGKFRGADFEPMSFRLDNVTHPRLIDARGRSIPTVIARHVGEVELEEIAKRNLTDQQRMLAEIEADGKASIAEYAMRLNWTHKAGPNKRRVHSLIQKLKAKKLIDGEPGAYAVTVKGRHNAG